jgi:hypothetical protein
MNRVMCDSVDPAQIPATVHLPGGWMPVALRAG